MAGEPAFLSTLTAAPGTSQPDRDDPRLNPAYAPLDDRDADALLAALRALAARLQHYADDPDSPSGTWLPYLPASTAAALDAAAGQAAPHHALLLAFLRLLAHPQALLNNFTGEHLAYQMQRVLGFVPLPPQPDRAHLVLEAKPGTPSIRITPSHRFSAGKDALKVEQLFAPVRDTVVGAARVERLVSLWHDGRRLRYAPLADSADGLGADLPAEEPRWPPFGHAALPAAPQGFAVASALLRLAEGRRKATLKLRLGSWSSSLTAAAVADAIEAWCTGPEGWIGPLAVSGAREGELLQLTVSLGETHPPVVDHAPDVHLQAFPAALPVLQLLLKPDADASSLVGLALQTAQLSVDVQNVRGLTLESDDAVLDGRKAFLPFGAQPVVGSQWHIGCAEALAKPVTAMTLHITWHGAPTDLYAWYDGYTRRTELLSGVAASVRWRHADGTPHDSGTVTLLPRMAAPTTLAVGSATNAYAATPHQQALALQWSGSIAGRLATANLLAVRPLAAPPRRLAPRLSAQVGSASASPAARAGVVTLTLTGDLLHADHARDAVAAATPPANASGFVPKVLNAPYTPKVQALTLDYTAESDLSAIASAEEAAFTDTAVQFFHVDALGVARVHAWLDRQRPWISPSPVLLMPRQDDAGALLIGLSGVAPGDEVSLLLQAAEGTADPLAPPQTVRWSVLADDAWRPLGAGELVLDTTRQLRTSGLVAAALPREVSLDHARCPSGLVWLRAAVSASPRAACDLIGVHANALEVIFVDQGNDPERLATPLAAGSISKVKSPPPGLKSVTQPYASFGGALVEAPQALARRAAERLRHRNRAVSSWDVERLVLQAFPQVWRVKCLPHASDVSWLAPGHVSLVVLPDLRHRQAVDPLQPRVDLDTLTRIADFVRARSAPQTQVHVRNPRYRAVQLDFKLRLRPGYGFAYWAPQVDLALRQSLSPWAFDAAVPLNFGGRVLRSALLALVESLPQVDFVTDFRLRHADVDEDLTEILPEAPDEILVSAPMHLIQELIDA